MKNLAFKRIYTGDYTDIGHHNGVNDGKEGKPKSHFGVLTQRHWINTLFWQANESHDSYVSGYDKGYDGGQRIRENIYHQTNTEGNTMSNSETDFNKVLMGLETAKNSIQLNIQQLEEEIEHYSRQINAMQEVGFAKQYSQQLNANNGLKLRKNNLTTILREFIKKLQEIEQLVLRLKRKAEQHH